MGDRCRPYSNDPKTENSQVGRNFSLARALGTFVGKLDENTGPGSLGPRALLDQRPEGTLPLWISIFSPVKWCQGWAAGRAGHQCPGGPTSPPTSCFRPEACLVIAARSFPPRTRMPAPTGGSPKDSAQERNACLLSSPRLPAPPTITHTVESRSLRVAMCTEGHP